MEKTYKNLQIQVKPADYNAIHDFCQKMDISKAQFIVRACKYFIAQNTLPPESDISGAEKDTEIFDIRK